MHCLSPQTKQVGMQNNTQLLQQPKNSVCQMAKSYSICILECRSHPRWLCGSGYNNQWKHLMWHGAIIHKKTVRMHFARR